LGATSDVFDVGFYLVRSQASVDNTLTKEMMADVLAVFKMQQDTKAEWELNAA
jgi:hypothetical protein